MATLLKLLGRRVTWRFLIVAAGAFGLAHYADQLGQLEVLVCSVVTCSD